MTARKRHLKMSMGDEIENEKENYRFGSTSFVIDKFQLHKAGIRTIGTTL